MSHPIPGHHYGEDAHDSDSPHKDATYAHPKTTKRAKSKGPLHNVADRLSAKTKALRKMMDENGGRHGTHWRSGDRDPL